MTMPNAKPNAWQAAQDLLKTIANLPAPDKVYFELQRLNNNMEKIQPDLARMAKALEGVSGADIRSLASALQGMRVSEILVLLNDFNSTVKSLYEKLWGKK